MKLPSNSPAARRGFTLIELLIVIAVIGVLAAIVLPVVGRMRESADQAKCVSNLRTLSAALLLAAGENNGILPMALDQSQPMDQRNWMNKVSATVGPWSPSTLGNGVPNSSVFNCPATKRKGVGTWPATNPCYGVNQAILGVAYMSGNPPLPLPTPSKSLAALNRLSKLGLIGDTAGNAVTGGIRGGDFRMNSPFFVRDGFPAGMSQVPTGYPAPRHPPPRNGTYRGGSFNLAFCDGHVETIKADDPRFSTQQGRRSMFFPE